MLKQNDNFFELVGNLVQLKYMMNNIIERHGSIHPILNKEDYKRLKDRNNYGCFPGLYDLNEETGKMFIGKIESYLLFVKNTYESEKKAQVRTKIDPIVENRLKRIWKETKILMKKYELDYDYDEDTLGEI